VADLQELHRLLKMPRSVVVDAADSQLPSDRLLRIEWYFSRRKYRAHQMHTAANPRRLDRGRNGDGRP
jgi:hypothetical protein